MRSTDFQRLVAHGIHVNPTAVLLTDKHKATPRLAMDSVNRELGIGHNGLAMDSVPGLITTPSAGIPMYLANLVDPEEIRIITQPNKAAEAYGETQKGNWTTFTAEFKVLESTGHTSSYGDYSESGRAGHNLNFLYRQSYHFQTFARWGERETDIEALAGVSYVSEQSIAAAIVLNKFMNKSDFYGIANLQLYGSLNDPSLTTPIAPTTKTAGPGSNMWGPGTPPEEIYADIQALFSLLQTQMGGNVRKDDAMTLVLSPEKEVWLENANSYGTLTAGAYIARGFKNLKIVSAPEMDTTGGSLIQMRLDKVDGKATTYCGFTEKMRNHAVIPKSSSWSQKKSAGTWGFIMRFPIAMVQMLGI